jgi:hypothetical protein
MTFCPICRSSSTVGRSRTVFGGDEVTDDQCVHFIARFEGARREPGEVEHENTLNARGGLHLVLMPAATPYNLEEALPNVIVSHVSPDV